MDARYLWLHWCRPTHHPDIAQMPCTWKEASTEIVCTHQLRIRGWRFQPIGASCRACTKHLFRCVCFRNIVPVLWTVPTWRIDDRNHLRLRHARSLSLKQAADGCLYLPRWHHTSYLLEMGSSTKQQGICKPNKIPCWEGWSMVSLAIVTVGNWCGDDVLHPSRHLLLHLQ